MKVQDESYVWHGVLNKCQGCVGKHEPDVYRIKTIDVNIVQVNCFNCNQTRMYRNVNDTTIMTDWNRDQTKKYVEKYLSEEQSSNSNEEKKFN